MTSFVLYVLQTWNCSEDQTNNFECKMRPKNLVPHFGLNNEVIVRSPVNLCLLLLLSGGKNLLLKSRVLNKNLPVFGKWDFFPTKYQ